MSGAPTPSPVGDSPNPYEPPTSNVHEKWGIGDPEAEELRRANAVLEAYAKGLGVLNFVFSVLFGLFAVSYATSAMGHIREIGIGAWIFRPDWIVALIRWWPVSILGFFAGYGFFRLRRWALRIEIVLVICWFSAWLIQIFVNTRPASLLMFLAETTGQLTLASPMLNIGDLWRSVVFEDEYSLAVRKTPHIKVKPKLPLELRLILVALAVAFFVMAYYAR